MDDPKVWNILVVDDDHNIQRSTKYALEDFSFNNASLNIYSAFSFDEAKVAINKYDDVAVIILDIVMESNDSGLRFAEYLRDEIKNDLVQIIVRTGESAKAPPKEIFERYGVEFYLEKQSQNDELLFNLLRAAINSFLRKREMKETLTKAKEEAEELAQNRMAFLAYMAHEIRGSLGQFSEGAYHLGRTKNLDEKQRKLVEIMQAGGEQVLEFCNDFLDHEKMNLNQMKLEERKFNLKELLEDVVKVSEVSLSEDRKSKIEVIGDVDYTIPDKVIGDPMRVRQVANNLMINALKFTKEGKVTLSAALKDNTDGFVEVIIVVRDSGVGVPEDKTESIFDPYAQAEDSTARIFKGTGLGLSICKQFVELMQGKIWVQNNPDGGAGFFFTAKLKKYQL